METYRVEINTKGKSINVPVWKEVGSFDKDNLFVAK